jgi:ABC-type antimicrobial peptide transport system permease subunit
MGRLLLICRLAAGDVRHRAVSAVLLVLAITTAATTLTLGLALHGLSDQPNLAYQQTRALTAGPDVVAVVSPSGGPAGGNGPKGGGGGGSAADAAALTSLTRTSGVVAHSGPYPFTFATLRGNGYEAGAEVEGRDQAAVPVDQPALTQGGWVRPGAVVLERSFAEDLGVGAGGRVTLNGRSFRVAGVAVTTATDLTDPQICGSGCDLPASALGNPGLVWMTRADAVSLATAAQPLSYTLNLKLADPADADAFANAYDNANTSASAPGLQSWVSLAWGTQTQVRSEQLLLLIGSQLLGLLAIASVAVLVGGRMAEQTRRVGLLKAVGSTPGLVATVLLAEHLVLAVVAAALGLLIGWLIAPLLTSPGAALIGSSGTPPVTLATIAIVTGVAVAVAALATLVPAIRAARTSTVGALADSARPPRRRARVIATTARLPVALMFGLRVAARRPRRIVLNVLSVAVTASGIVAVLMVHAHFDASFRTDGGLIDPQNARLSQVVTVISVALVLLAAINAILITWATVLDARHTSALARALGATPQQVSAGLSAAQVLPALVGALLGIPGGIALVSLVNQDGKTLTLPPLWWLVDTVLGTAAAVAAITVVPAWLGTRRPASEVLQAD